MSNGTIGLDADHIDLRDSVRALATRHITEESVRAAVEAKDEQLPAWWPTAADQGLLGLHLPESAGGAGYGHLELCVVLEELGRCLAPGPFLPTVLASAVLHAASHHLHLPGLADGTTVGAVALGGDLSAVVSAQGLIVSGTTAPVSGGQLADLFVLPVQVGDDLQWVIVRRGAMTIQHPPSHDLTRRLAVAELDEVPVAADAVLSLDHAHPYDLAAVLLGAEATGIADWSTDTATAYAGQRHQFGRPIGQFQAVKHRIARMLVRTEQARACVWDAARAADEEGASEGEAALAAAVCGAVAVDAGFGVVKDLVNTLGGIGYTWEHLAGFALRRTQTSRILLGPSTDWFGKVAELSLAGVRR
ncbi:MAG: acyl-CoA/acyl-ACP dehydrogenase, partial [Nocardioides sp.]|nr:acyl-CoA/acyl-ACP dehydrogenase [Nocardioides sp.]